MKELKATISEIFNAIEELEGNYFKENEEYYQKNKIDILDENGNWVSIKGLIKKKDKIRTIKFNSSIELKVADKHKLSVDGINCVFASELKFGQEILIANGKKISIIDNSVSDIEELVYDMEVESDTHLYQDANGIIHHNTELAKALADILFNNENSIIRIDMSEYQEGHTVSRLTGAPPGYVGYEEGGQLTEAVRRKPYSVVLLDEMEKAHPDIFNVLLQVLDDGRLTDNKGRVVNFKNTIIIMTSNMGSHIIQENSEKITDTNKEEILEKTKTEVFELMKKVISPEFLNRVDETIMFLPLTKEDVKKITGLQINSLRKRLVEKEIVMSVTDGAMSWLAEKGYDPQFGARPIKRVIQRYVTDELSKELLSGGVHNNSEISFDIVNNIPTFTNIEKKQKEF